MSKGSSFERAFCDQLSEWWTGEPGRRVFWRSSNSGGMATARNKKGKTTQQHCGDVCAIDPVGFPLTDLITIELKRGYSRHTIADLLDKPKNAAKQVYEKWIDQAYKASERSGTPYWLLVVKRDLREPIVFMTEELWSFLFLAGDSSIHPILDMSDPSGGFNLVAFTLESFFHGVDPKSLLPQNGKKEIG